MKVKSTLMAGVSAATVALSAQAVFAGGHGEITVAYFLEWPMPFEYAKQLGTYDEELGVKVNWVSFESGVKMSAAMASGDVHLSVSRCRLSSLQRRQVKIFKSLMLRSVTRTMITALCAANLRSTKTAPRNWQVKKFVPLGTAALRFPETNVAFWC